MHPYSGGSKLASVSSRPDLQKGVQNEVKETPSRGKVEPPLPPHHQNFSTTPSIEISQLKKKKKKGPPRLGVQRRAGLRLLEAVVSQEHGGQGRGGEGEGGLSRRRALSLEERGD